MKTPLYDAHQEHSARLIDFAGWDMPVQYPTGILKEHAAVRERAGLFDVSHMGQFLFEGPDAVETVNRLITNDLHAIGDGRAQYTVLCNESGHILDDAISYRFSADQVMMVVNASNVQKIADWVRRHATGNTRFEDQSADWALLALQGPRAPAIGALLHPSLGAMTPFQVQRFALPEAIEVGHEADRQCIAATTGYTGESGFELFLPKAAASAVWRHLMQIGADDGLTPCGLGARDTLRLEMGYCLYGNDIDESTNPLEAGLAWVTKLKKADGFIGQDALRAVREAGITRRLVGIQMAGRGIPRHGYRILDAAGDQEIGTITSGTRSPSTQESIGLGYVDRSHRKTGTKLNVEIRGRLVPAAVVKPPFYRSDSD